MGTGSLRVYLQRNGKLITSAYGHDIPAYNVITFHSTLRLQKSDEISLGLYAGILRDLPDFLYTNFVGWLAEEDLTG